MDAGDRGIRRRRAYDKFELQGHFAATQPTDVSFDASNDLMTTTVPGTASTLYNQGAQTIPGNTQNLWLKLKMPVSTGIGRAALAHGLRQRTGELNARLTRGRDMSWIVKGET